jgi:hypothetical protein
MTSKGDDMQTTNEVYIRGENGVMYRVDGNIVLTPVPDMPEGGFLLLSDDMEILRALLTIPEPATDNSLHDAYLDEIHTALRTSSSDSA